LPCGLSRASDVVRPEPYIPLVSRHFIPNPTQPNLDEDGFPILGDDTLGTLFVDDWRVIWHAQLIGGLGTLGWLQVGKLGR
jgi:hypothetical protein